MLNRTASPLAAGDFSIAYEILHGTAHLYWSGDSIPAALFTRLPQELAPDRVKGFGSAGFSGSSQFGGQSTINIASQGLPSILFGNNGTTGFATYSIFGAAELKFTAGQAFGSSEPNTFAYRVNEGELPMAYVGRTADMRNREDWPVGSDLRVRHVYRVYPGGSTNKFRFGVRHTTTTAFPRATVGNPIDFNAATAAFAYEDLPVIPAGFLTADPDELWGGFYGVPGASAVNGDSGVLAAVRIERDGPGLTVTNGAWGGSYPERWIDANWVDPAAWSILVPLGVTHALWCVTMNNPTALTRAQYKTAMGTLIDRQRAYVPNMPVVLLPAYDADYSTGGGDGQSRAHLSEFAAACYEISQERPRVLFLNLFRAMDAGINTAAAGLLDAQFIHPNEFGKHVVLATIMGLLRTVDPGRDFGDVTLTPDTIDAIGANAAARVLEDPNNPIRTVGVGAVKVGDAQDGFFMPSDVWKVKGRDANPLTNLNGIRVSTIAPTDVNGRTVLVRGDSYENGANQDRRLTYTVTGFTGNIAGATVTWKIVQRLAYERDGDAEADFTAAGTATLDGTTLTMLVPLTAAQTTGLTHVSRTSTDYKYRVQVVLVGSDGKALTQVLADAAVLKEVN